MRPVIVWMSTVLAVSACATKQSEPGTPTPSTEATPTPTPIPIPIPPPPLTPTPTTQTGDGGGPTRVLRKEGELCGGFAGLKCAPGLVCKMPARPHPDQGGVCVQP